MDEKFLVKWSAFSRWSIDTNSEWGSIETITIGKTHPTLAKSYSDESFDFIVKSESSFSTQKFVEFSKLTILVKN